MQHADKLLGGSMQNRKEVKNASTALASSQRAFSDTSNPAIERALGSTTTAVEDHPALPVAGPDSSKHAETFTNRWFDSPHRLVTWFLAASTLIGLGVAAFSWSMLLDGRWTILSVTAVLTTFGVLFTHGYFRVNMANEGALQLRLAAVASAIGVTAALFAVSLPSLGQPRVPTFVGLMLALLCAAVVGRGAARLIVRLLWRRGRLRASALVYGVDDLAREMAVEINHRRSYGVDVVGFIAVGASDPLLVPPRTEKLPAPVFRCRGEGGVAHSDLAAAVQSTGADRLIIGPASTADDRTAQQMARWAVTNGMPVHVVPRFYQMGLGFDSMSPDRARGYPLVRLQRSAHPQLSIRLKRVVDVVVAGLVLVATAPVMLVAALAVRMTSPGPILFAQERIGQHNRPIVVRKFRSMTVSSESDTEWNAEARVTTVGKWLRRLNVDELPQLWSILVGDMSLVGPRPERPIFVERFQKQIPDYNDRHRMPVGLTGLAQVVGFRGDTSIIERVKYDNLYIDQWSLRADFEILFRTVTAILFQPGKERMVLELDRVIEAAVSRSESGST